MLLEDILHFQETLFAISVTSHVVILPLCQLFSIKFKTMFKIFAKSLIREYQNLHKIIEAGY